MNKWKKMSLYVALPATALLCVVNMGILATNGHHHYADEDYVPGKGGVEVRSCEERSDELRTLYLRSQSTLATSPRLSAQAAFVVTQF